MVLNTELLNAPQGNNSRCIYSAELYGDRKSLPNVEAVSGRSGYRKPCLRLAEQF